MNSSASVSAMACSACLAIVQDDAVLGDRVEAGGIDHQEFAFRPPRP